MHIFTQIYQIHKFWREFNRIRESFAPNNRLASDKSRNCRVFRRRTLRRLRSRLRTTVSLLTDFDQLLNSKLPLIVRKMLYTLTVGLGNASRRFSGTLNSKSRQGQSSCQRRRSQKSSRACLFAGRPWPFAGKTLIPCGRASDQIEIFFGYDQPKIPSFSLLQSSSI